MQKITILAILLITMYNNAWANNITLPSVLDNKLIQQGALDNNYKIKDQEKLAEYLNKINNKSSFLNNREVVAPNKIEAIMTIGSQGVDIDLYFLTPKSNKEVEGFNDNALKDLTDSLLLPEVCSLWARSIYTKINEQKLNVFFKARDGSFIGKAQSSNADCDWDKYKDYYRQLGSGSHIPHYAIAPVFPSLKSSELNWKNHTLRLRLFINSIGDIEKVDFIVSSELPYLNQLVKEAFLKAKFTPYIENGKPVPFTTIQPVDFDANEDKSIIIRLANYLLNKK